MIYVGMDVSSKSFVVHAINEKKKVVFKGEVEATERGLRGVMRRVGEGPLVEAGLSRCIQEVRREAD